jgi:hypothetical protein
MKPANDEATEAVTDLGSAELRQHAEIVIERGATAKHARARVRGQTMLDRYLKRKLITHRQFMAGRKVYADWFAAGLPKRITSSYEPRVAGNDGESQKQIDAYKAYRAAMKRLTDRLSGVIVHVCLLDHSSEEWARQVGRRVIDGPTILRLALDMLGDHYGYEREEQVQSQNEIASASG